MEKFKVTANSFSNEVFIRSSTEAVIFREHRITTERIDIDVQTGCWTLAWAQVPKDQVYYRRGSEWKELSGSVVIYRSPFSLVHWRLNPGTLNWGYLVSYDDIPTAENIPSKIISSPFLDMESANILNSIKNDPGFYLDADIQDDCVHDFKKALDDAFQATLNIQDLLPKNRNYSYTSREFTKRYGIAPVKYRNKLRLMQAAQDLMFSGKSVETVFHQNGISDPKYFYSRFKKLFGAFPAQFRRGHANEVHL